MSKKKKTKVFTDVLETIEIEKIASVNETLSSNTVDSNVEVTNFMKKNEEIKYDDTIDVKEELVKLNSENSDLTDKLAEYIEEIQKLKQQYAELQEENDKHLMKIAELSFENATLQASLKNIDVDAKNNTNTFNPHQNSKNVNYQNQQNNIFINRSGLNTGDYWN